MNTQEQSHLRDEVDKALGEGGVIAAALPNYEVRPQQRKMAACVCEAITFFTHLIAEAGTGVGKTFSYLVALIIYAVKNNKKVIVSTNTKTLQQQLCQKDLPFLKEVLGIDFKYAICLGSDNYLCLRRFNDKHIHKLLESDAQRDQFEKISEWATKTKTGIKSEMGFTVMRSLWEHICREPDLCLHQCPYTKECFYKRAKEEQKNADILIANHALLFINIASGNRVLPPFDVVVLDEAQTIESVATDHLGFKVTNTQVKHLCDSIYNPKTGKGLLTKFRNKKRKTHIDVIYRCLEESRIAADQLFGDIGRKFGVKSNSQRIRTKNVVFNFLNEPLKSLSRALNEILDYVSKREDKALIKSFIKRCDEIKAQLSSILNLEQENYVYWIEIAAKRYGVKYSLCANPVEVGEELNKQLFSRISSVILTSATLAVNDSFDFIKGRLGIKKCRQILLNSPFNYEKNAMLYLPRGIEDPNNNPAVFQSQVLEHIKAIVDIMKGRTFVLFTSYWLLNLATNILRTNYKDLNILQQGDKPRYELLEEFKQKPNSILLGTATFWQGIDVAGRALECVVITKLPFAVPNDPVTEARIELIRSRNGNPFKEYQIPQALSMFRQGFGRLIRTKTDRGVVAVLDPRVTSKGYGRLFLNSVPKCKHTNDINDVRNFFNIDSQTMEKSNE